MKKLTVTDEEIKVTDEFEIMLSEISQTQKHLYFMISPYEVPRIVKFDEMESTTGTGGLRRQGVTF